MFRFLVLIALAAGSVIGLTSHPASAYPLCEKVATTGTVVGSHLVGDCIPYGGATLCADDPPLNAGLDPSAHVWITVCVPD